MKIHKKKIFSNEKSIYDSKKEKSFENTHKLHRNSKIYLDVQNEYAPKLKLSWVVSDPTQTWPVTAQARPSLGKRHSDQRVL